MTKISFEIQQQIIQCFGLCFHYKDTVVSFMQASGVPNNLGSLSNSGHGEK